MSDQRSSKEWATRARFEKIKAEMAKGVPGYSEFRFDWMHDALRELIDYCDALHADEPKATDEGVADARRWIAYLESDPQHEPDISIARVLRDLVQFYEWALPQITNRTAEPPSFLQRERFIDEWARAAFAALLSLSNARVVELGQKITESETDG